MSQEPQATKIKAVWLYIIGGISLIVSLVCLGLILPELVLMHQLNYITDRLADRPLEEQRDFLFMLGDYSSNIAFLRSACGIIAGFSGASVWIIGKAPWFAYIGVMGATAFALNLLMMITF